MHFLKAAIPGVDACMCVFDKVFLFYESNVVDHIKGRCINHTVVLSYCCCVLVIVLLVGTCGCMHYILFILQIYMCSGLLFVSWSHCSAVEHLKQGRP